MQENLDQQATDSLTLVNLYNLQSLLSRINANLSIINSGPNAQIVTVVGGNLFELAVKYYNDATKWYLIAQANNLFDPELNGITTLTIPPDTATSNGGLLSA